MPDQRQDAPPPATGGQPRVQIHETQFHRNTRTGLWRGVCACGWVKFGERDEVQAGAATHDMDWVAEPAPQPAAVSP